MTIEKKYSKLFEISFTSSIFFEAPTSPFGDMGASITTGLVSPLPTVA